MVLLFTRLAWYLRVVYLGCRSSDDLGEAPRRGAGAAGSAGPTGSVPAAAAARHDARVPGAAAAAVPAVRAASPARHARAARAPVPLVPCRAELRAFPSPSVVRAVYIPDAGAAVSELPTASAHIGLCAAGAGVVALAARVCAGAIASA